MEEIGKNEELSATTSFPCGRYPVSVTATGQS